MLSLKDLPSPSTVYSAYASLSASTMLLRTTFDQVVPRQLQNFVSSTIRHYFLNPKKTSQLTLVIEEKDGITYNQIYSASETFTSTKLHHQPDFLKISKYSQADDQQFTLRFANFETVVNCFQGVEVTWRFVCQNLDNNDYDDLDDDTRRFFELSFDKKHKDLILDFYVPFVLEQAKAIEDGNKVVQLHSLRKRGSGHGIWDSVKLEHPSSFEKIAMEPRVKKALIEDLDLFVSRLLVNCTWGT